MVPNKIKELRVSKGITQKDLAEATETSQQQIQRIEAGNQSVRFDLALKICEALDTPLEIVFPNTRLPLKRALEKKPRLENLLQDEDLEKDLSAAGVDLSCETHSLRCGFRGGREEIFPIASGGQKKYLWNRLQHIDEQTPFVIFDSPFKRIILNQKHLVFFQFLFDAPCNRFEEKEEEGDEVRVFMVGEGKPYTFGVDPDDPVDSNDEEIVGQFADMVLKAETLIDDGDLLSFMDEDGERAFFRAIDVASIEIPLWVFEPELLDEEDERD